MHGTDHQRRIRKADTAEGSNSGVRGGRRVGMNQNEQEKEGEFRKSDGAEVKKPR